MATFKSLYSIYTYFYRYRSETLRRKQNTPRVISITDMGSRLKLLRVPMILARCTSVIAACEVKRPQAAGIGVQGGWKEATAPGGRERDASQCVSYALLLPTR